MSSYTFAGDLNGAADQNGVFGQAFNIGATAGPFVIVAISMGDNSTFPGSGDMVIDPSGANIALHLDAVLDPAASTPVAFYSGVATSLSGSKTIQFTLASQDFNSMAMAVWYTTSTINGVENTGTNNDSNTLSITVNPNDFLFVFAGGFNITDLANSTVAPSNTNQVASSNGGPGGISWVAVDWNISAATASNTSLSIASNSANDFQAIAVTYAPQQPAAPAPLLNNMTMVMM